MMNTMLRSYPAMSIGFLALALGFCTPLIAADQAGRIAVQGSGGVKLECRMNSLTKIPSDTDRYKVKRVSCQEVDRIEDEFDRDMATSACEAFVFDPSEGSFKVSQDQRRYEYYRNAQKAEYWKYIDRSTGEYRSKYEVKSEYRRPNMFVVTEVRVHGVPKAATPAIGARDVSREVSVAS